MLSVPSSRLGRPTDPTAALAAVTPFRRPGISWCPAPRRTPAVAKLTPSRPASLTQDYSVFKERPGLPRSRPTAACGAFRPRPPRSSIPAGRGSDVVRRSPDFYPIRRRLASPRRELFGRPRRRNPLRDLGLHRLPPPWPAVASPAREGQCTRSHSPVNTPTALFSARPLNSRRLFSRTAWTKSLLRCGRGGWLGSMSQGPEFKGPDPLLHCAAAKGQTPLHAVARGRCQSVECTANGLGASEDQRFLGRGR